MSRSRHYIGVDLPEITVEATEELHWYEAWLLGYRAKAWPKQETDCDDIRYDLKESE